MGLTGDCFDNAAVGAVSCTPTCENHLEPPLPHLAGLTSYIGRLQSSRRIKSSSSPTA